MNKYGKIFLAAILLLCVSAAAPARAGTEIRLRRTSAISSFTGGNTFAELGGLWLDRQDYSIFVLDEKPFTVFKFDRYGSSIRYYTVNDITLSGIKFAGAVADGIFIRHSKGMAKLSKDFTDVSDAEFYFEASTGNSYEKKIEKVPLVFSAVFPGKTPDIIYGFDPDKKNLYECAASGSCRVFIRTYMKYGADVLTGKIKSATRDIWGRYYFVDEQARQVWKFSSDGKFLGAAARPIDPVSERLYQPELVAVDRLKRCYIYDAGIRRIKVYNDMGIVQGEIDSNPPTGPLFIYPSAMEIDELNRLIVMDSGDMSVKIFEVTF